MSIQYLSDTVIYSYPGGLQTDYEAMISIMFSVVNNRISSEPYVYTDNVTGGTSGADIIAKYHAARERINDNILLAYASSSRTLFDGGTSGE